MTGIREKRQQDVNLARGEGWTRDEVLKESKAITQSEEPDEKDEKAKQVQGKKSSAAFFVM